MLIATLIHWDRFNHGDAPALAAIAFYGWVIVYIVSPFAVVALWWPTAALIRRAAAGRAARCRRPGCSPRGCSDRLRSAAASCSSFPRDRDRPLRRG